jgi:hypothetical protein
MSLWLQYCAFVHEYKCIVAMKDGEELLDCVFSVDEILSEVEEALEHKNYSVAMHKLREARDAINDMREDDESEYGRQEIDMDVVRRIQ